MKAFLRHIAGFFFSLNTTIWFTVLLIAAFLAGAFIMPVREEFQSIHSAPFFQWLTEQPLSVTWWLWLSIAILVIIVINTIFCSIESVVKKRKATQWLLLISPQIIHIGFLFMLLAHFLTASGGSQQMSVAEEGSFIKLTEDNGMLIKDIDIQLSSSGYVNDWAVKIEYYLNNDMVKEDRIAPNSPSLYKGYNINLKDMRAYPSKMVLLQISREPGAVWALTGGILFTIGIVLLIALKIRMEKR
jgi:cytochrome c biogenesis protein ResB